MKLGIVGPGRLGRSLVEWFGPHHDVRLHGRGAVPSEAEVVLLTVPDGAVAEVARSLPIGPVVLHCAGALGTDVLAPHRQRGSFHPLMTFPGPEVALPDPHTTPVALAGTPEAVAVGRQLANDVGMQPFDVPGDRRLYHAAAVLAGNLVTVLYDEAVQVLKQAGVAPELARRVLLPLAERSLANAPQGLRQSLTGPVARGDHATLQSHRQALSAQHPGALPLYNALVHRAIARLSPLLAVDADETWHEPDSSGPEEDLS